MSLGNCAPDHKGNMIDDRARLAFELNCFLKRVLSRQGKVKFILYLMLA